nr:MAG TPA: hypothetical protein [Caudoviricetes sp.]
MISPRHLLLKFLGPNLEEQKSSLMMKHIDGLKLLLRMLETSQKLVVR